MKRLLYNLKITFKNKELIFWTIAFPIILGTLFYAAFSNIKTAENYEPIKIAVAKNEKNRLYPIYTEVLKTLSEGEDRVFDTTYYDTKDEAVTQIHDDEVSGAVVFENENDYPELLVEKSSIDQTIVQNVMTEIEQAMVAGRGYGFNTVVAKGVLSYQLEALPKVVQAVMDLLEPNGVFIFDLQLKHWTLVRNALLFNWSAGGKFKLLETVIEAINVVQESCLGTNHFEKIVIQPDEVNDEPVGVVFTVRK